MKAIKIGEPVEDKAKKYEPFESEVSSGNGKLDITSLADPLAPAGAALNEAPAPIKTIKQEAKSSPPPPEVCESTASPKDLMTPPSSIFGDIKPTFQGSPSADILSPQSDASDCPPNVVSLHGVLTTFTNILNWQRSSMSPAHSLLHLLNFSLFL